MNEYEIIFINYHKYQNEIYRRICVVYHKARSKHECRLYFNRILNKEKNNILVTVRRFNKDIRKVKL